MEPLASFMQTLMASAKAGLRTEWEKFFVYSDKFIGKYDRSEKASRFMDEKCNSTLSLLEKALDDEEP